MRHFFFFFFLGGGGVCVWKGSMINKYKSKIDEDQVLIFKALKFLKKSVYLSGMHIQ